ncbi:MAG: GNAT family N-acetyltransferase [Candidatus Moranbacteria bacterium]|jgi:ribosomal protein S18 acetylase RimI-like enzyme|nr:GNAT family N-acetyltransferase [Candidatus Moranbacteria bacterium]
MKIFRQELSIKDIDKILVLYNDVFPESLWSKNYLKLFMKSEKAIFIVAEERKKIEGFIFGKERNKNLISLDVLGVSEKFRDKKVGTRLMKFFIEKTKEKMTRGKIIIHFRDSKKSLVYFYSKFGAKNDKIVGKYRNGEYKHQMEIDI